MNNIISKSFAGIHPRERENVLAIYREKVLETLIKQYR
jgi:hypothetical protein